MMGRPETGMWYFIARRPGLYGGLAVVLFVSAVLEALTVAGMYPLVSAMLGGPVQAVGGQLIASLQWPASFVPYGSRVWAAVLLMLTLITLKSASVVLRDYLIAAGGADVVFETKRDLFRRLKHAAYEYYVSSRKEDLAYRLTSAPQSLGVVLLLLPSLAAQALIVMAICTLLFSVSWKLTAAVIMAGGVMYGLLRQVARRVSHVVGRQRTEALARELGAVDEFLTGIKDILTARVSEKWERAYSRHGQGLRQAHVRDSVWQSLPGVLIEWGFFVLVALFAVGSQGEHDVSLAETAPMLAVYAYALYRLIRAVSILSHYKLRLVSHLADVELLHHALTDPIPSWSEEGEQEPSFTRVIRFCNVSFAHCGRAELSLDRVNLEICKGGMTAIVGHSGAGKTTLVNMLLRLYDPTEGAIEVDGRDLRTFARASWLARIGYVGQEVFLFYGTVADNIRFGLEDASDEDVKRVAEIAYADDFIARMSQGYHTLIGDRGRTLSGGQCQRIAIARALLRRPDILVFDEATSQLDGVSEALIQRAMREVARDHTVIVVAHRVSTVRGAGHIVVLERGRVVENGTHDELVARRGAYSLMMAPLRE